MMKSERETNLGRLQYSEEGSHCSFWCSPLPTWPPIGMEQAAQQWEQHKAILGLSISCACDCQAGNVTGAEESEEERMRMTTCDSNVPFPFSVLAGVTGSREVQPKGSTSSQGPDPSRSGDWAPAETSQGERGTGQCCYPEPPSLMGSSQCLED
jgi:hypothetical protein